MKAFKLFFLIAKSRTAASLSYFAVFLIMFLLTTSSGAQGEMAIARPTVAFIDRDQTPLTEHVKQAMSKDVDFFTVKDDENAILDACYGGMIDVAVIIPKGFTADFADGKHVDLETVSPTDSITTKSAAQSAKGYLTLVDGYRVAYGGKIPQEKWSHVLAECDSILANRAKIESAGTEEVSEAKNAAAFFSYADFVFIAVAFFLIGYPMNVIEERLVKRRELVGPVPEGVRTRALFLASFALGLTVWLIFPVMLAVRFGLAMLVAPGVPVIMLSSLLHALTVICMVFFLCQLFPGKDSVNGMSTVLSLVVAFTTGIFIPRRFLWPPLLKASSIFPTYWNKTTLVAAGNGTLTPSLFWTDTLVMLLMATAFFLLSLLIRKARMREKAA